MDNSPKMRFLSLFVPDLEKATMRYRDVLGIEPLESPTAAPQGHPFAAAGPVVFDLGGVELALYQCDMRATHPGDVGIGVETEDGPKSMARRAAAQGGKVFFGKQPISPDDARAMAVFVLPDRHFFEVVGGSAQKT